MASLPYPRTPLSPRLYPSFPTLAPLFLPLHALLFPLFTPSLFLFILPTFVIRIDRRRCSYRPTQTSAPTDADIRTDRRRCSYRPTRMLVTTDADARIGRRRCSYRPTQMAFVDVSQCQTFTFAVSNLYFRAAKPLLLRLKTSLFTFYTLFFLQYLPLFSSISSAFLLCASSGCSP